MSRDGFTLELVQQPPAKPRLPDHDFVTWIVT